MLKAPNINPWGVCPTLRRGRRLCCGTTAPYGRCGTRVIYAGNRVCIWSRSDTGWRCAVRAGNVTGFVRGDLVRRVT